MNDVKVNDKRGMNDDPAPRPSGLDLISVELGKMSLKPGDVVLVRLPKDSDAELIHGVAQAVNAAVLPTGATWLGMFEGTELEHVTAERMKELGWMRVQ